MRITVTANYGNPATKLADAEVTFENGDFAGLTLKGFAIWTPKRPGAPLTYDNVSTPTLAFGRFKRIPLLVNTDEQNGDTLNGLRDQILAAYLASDAAKLQQRAGAVAASPSAVAN